MSNLLKEIDVPSEDGVTVRSIEVTYADPREVAQSLSLSIREIRPMREGLSA